MTMAESESEDALYNLMDIEYKLKSDLDKVKSDSDDDDSDSESDEDLIDFLFESFIKFI